MPPSPLVGVLGGEAVRKSPGLRLAFDAHEPTPVPVAEVDAVAVEASVQQVEPCQVHVDDEALQAALGGGAVVEIHRQASLVLRGLESVPPPGASSHMPPHDMSASPCPMAGTAGQAASVAQPESVPLREPRRARWRLPIPLRQRMRPPGSRAERFDLEVGWLRDSAEGARRSAQRSGDGTPKGGSPPALKRCFVPASSLLVSVAAASPKPCQLAGIYEWSQPKSMRTTAHGSPAGGCRLKMRRREPSGLDPESPAELGTARGGRCYGSAVSCSLDPAEF
jgi:hypothetical protein